MHSVAFPIALRMSCMCPVSEGVVSVPGPACVQTKLYSPDQLNELMSVSDYIVMATPWTPQTHKV